MAQIKAQWKEKHGVKGYDDPCDEMMPPPKKITPPKR